MVVFGDFCVGLRIVRRSFTKVNSLLPHLPALNSPKRNFKKFNVLPMSSRMLRSSGGHLRK